MSFDALEKVEEISATGKECRIAVRERAAQVRSEVANQVGFVLAGGRRQHPAQGHQFFVVIGPYGGIRTAARKRARLDDVIHHVLAVTRGDKVQEFGKHYPLHLKILARYSGLKGKGRQGARPYAVVIGRIRWILRRSGQPYTGNRRHSAITWARTRSITDSSPIWSITSAIQCDSCLTSASLKPRVVTAGVPIRSPLLTMGGRGSFGTAFLFTVMCARPSAASASLPVRFLSIKSTRNR